MKNKTTKQKIINYYNEDVTDEMNTFTINVHSVN